MESPSGIENATDPGEIRTVLTGISVDERINKLIKAFGADGFDVDRENDVVLYGACIGMRATHRTAVIGKTGVKKRVFYIEGDPRTMGYLQGRLSEPEIERMCTEFNENIVIDFINVQIKDPEFRKVLGEILEEIIYLISKNMLRDVPSLYIDELDGIVAGCSDVHPATKVDRQSLWVLNVGIDAILSYIYTGISPHARLMAFEMKPEYLRIPIMCNGFSASGVDSRVQSRFHYLGRDFMFSTAGVYQDTAAMIIRNPEQGIPTVSVAAPGMIGTIAGMNIAGVGVGVDMCPASNCNPARPGFNSLLLARESIQNGSTCDEAVGIMVNARRGVTWDYILADGTTDKACILEAGESVDTPNFLVHTDDWVIDALKEIDPDFEEMLKTPSTYFRKGSMARWSDYAYPIIYQQFNKALIDAFRKHDPDYSYIYDGQDFTERGFINKKWTEKNCPGPYYFAPQRELIPEMVLTTNHYVIPEMRFNAMNFWISIIASANLNDIQWRYDELNAQLLTTLAKGFMTYEEARSAIDFLAPSRMFPDYYNEKKKQLDEVPVHGAVSLMDLKAKTIESHYGYYADEWLKITLGNYF